MNEELTRHIKNWVVVIIAYLIRYFSYSFLVVPVIVCFSILTIMVLSIGKANPDLMVAIFSTIKLFAFLNPAFGKDVVELGIGEIMQIFGFLSIILWILSFFVSVIVVGVLKKKLEIPLKQKILYAAIILGILHIMGVISSIIMSGITWSSIFSFLMVFITFYIMSFISIVIYFGLNTFSFKIQTAQIR